MRRLGLILFGLLLTIASFAAAGQQTLSIGLFPNLSTRLLLETYQPLRDFLEQRLAHPVTLYTAPDFNSFIERSQKGEYDLIVTAPHFARLAEADAGYQPMFVFQNKLSAAIVVPKNSPITGISELRGAKIAAPDRLALVTMLGMKLLHDHGLESNKDYAFQWTATHGNAALAVQRGEAQAGLIGILPLKQLPESISRQLQILSVTPAVPSQMLLVHRRLDSAQRQRIKDSLLAFEQSEAGQQFFKATGLKGFQPVSTSDLKQLDPYAREVKRMQELAK